MTLPSPMRLFRSATPYRQGAFRRAFDAAPVGMLMLDQDMNILQVNGAWRKMLGLGAGERNPAHLVAVLREDELALLATLNAELFAGRRSAYQIEQHYRHKDGHDAWCRVDAALAEQRPGKRPFAVVTFEDISDRKRLELVRRRRLSTCELILAAAAWGVLTVDCAGLVTFANPAAASMLGASVQTLLGQPVLALQTAPGGGPLAAAQCQVGHALSDGLTRRGGMVFACADGSSCLTESIVIPILDGGVVTAAAVTFLKIADAAAHRLTGALTLHGGRS